MSVLAPSLDAGGPAVCRRYAGGMPAVCRRICRRYAGGMPADMPADMPAVCRQLVRGDARMIDAECRKMGENSAFQRPRSGVSVDSWMARLVIHTPAGVPIASAEVPADEVIEVLKSWILILAPTQQSCWTASHLPRVTSSAHYRRRKHRHNRQCSRHNRHNRSQRRRPSTMHSPFTMISTLFVKASGNSLHHVQQRAREMADETLRRTREIADEAVRQRTLLHQCLRDCDAVDRSILVEPWTLTAALYPGARWAGGSDEDRVAMIPFTPTWKVATIGGLLGLLAVAAWPRRR